CAPQWSLGYRAFWEALAAWSGWSSSCAWQLGNNIGIFGLRWCRAGAALARSSGDRSGQSVRRRGSAAAAGGLEPREVAVAAIGAVAGHPRRRGPGPARQHLAGDENRPDQDEAEISPPVFPHGYLRLSAIDARKRAHEHAPGRARAPPRHHPIHATPRPDNG